MSRGRMSAEHRHVISGTSEGVSHPPISGEEGAWIRWGTRGWHL